MTVMVDDSLSIQVVCIFCIPGQHLPVISKRELIQFLQIQLDAPTRQFERQALGRLLTKLLLSYAFGISEQSLLWTELSSYTDSNSDEDLCNTKKGMPYHQGSGIASDAVVLSAASRGRW